MDTSRFVGICALLLAACGSQAGDDPSGSDTESDGSTSASGTSSGGTTGPGTGTGLGSTGYGETTGASTGPDIDPEPGNPAGGIRVSDVLANQGVEIPLSVDGIPVATADRVAPIIGRRPMLLRAMWDLDPGFVPRDLEGRLVLLQGDGTRDVFSDIRSVSGASDVTSADGGFRWDVPADALSEQTRFHVGIYETADAATQGTPLGWRFPGDGDNDLDAWGDPMVMDLMLVPISGCGDTPVLDAEAVAMIDAYVYNTFPLSELNIEVHDPVPGSCDEWEVTFDVLPALRDADDAPPGQYYVGVIGGSGAGVSQPTEGSEDPSYPRTSSYHLWRDYGPNFDLLAHELGHNHGREHTFDDGDYPYANGGPCGARETRGFGVRPGEMPSSQWSNDIVIGALWVDMQQIIPPTGANCEAGVDTWSDFMSYTYPFWVSDYTYGALADRVRLIAGWGAVRPGGVTLRGLVRPDRRVSWTVTLGAERPVAAPDDVAWTATGQALPIYRRTPPREVGQPAGFDVVVVPMPNGPVADELFVPIDEVPIRVDVSALAARR